MTGLVELTPEQLERFEGLQSFVAQNLAPYAALYDSEKQLPRLFLDQLFASGYFCATLPRPWGGAGWDIPMYGLLHMEIGGELASAAAVITVHDMLAQALVKWGNSHQKRSWLPDLASGRQLGSFAVTEDVAGSDIGGVQTTAVRKGSSYVLNGTKRWVTGGLVATLFLVLVKIEGKATVFIVDHRCPGLSVRPVKPMLGFRAAMLADLHLEDCVVAAQNILGRVNLGIEGPIQTALDLGRYAVACSSSGLAAACLRVASAHATVRRQFGLPLHRHQLVAKMLTDMVANVRASRLLCWHAGCDRETGRSEAVLSTLIAKYFASRAAVGAAFSAVQIMGARGCVEDSPAARYFRDSKIMEIIEGSSEIHQTLISQLIRRDVSTDNSDYPTAVPQITPGDEK